MSQVNYTLQYYPVDGLNPFDMVFQSDISPVNIGGDADGLPDGDFLQMIMTPIDPLTHEVRAKDFTIGGIDPTITIPESLPCSEYDLINGCGDNSTLDYAGFFMWIDGEQSINYLGQTVNTVLHPWVSYVTISDLGPGFNPGEEGFISNYISHNRVLVRAYLKQNMAIPPFDYIINLDIDGDANPVPPPFTSASFNITCTIEGPNGSTPCAKVFPLIANSQQCLDSMTNWQFEQQSISNTVARIKCTNTTGDPQYPFVWPNCVPGGVLVTWFGITPVAGHTLSRWNCDMASSMYSPSTANWGFTPSENEVQWGVANPPLTLMDIDGTIIGPEAFPISRWENWAATLTYTDPSSLNQTTYLNHWGNGNASASWPGGNPSGAYSSFGLPGTGVGGDAYGSIQSGFFSLLDTNINLGDPEYIDILGNYTTNLDVVLGEPSLFVNNNVIVAFDGMLAWIPGENPPDIDLKIKVNNCGMTIGGDFVEDEWIGFNNVFIFESDDVTIGEDTITISGEGSFDEEWGEDE